MSKSKVDNKKVDKVEESSIIKLDLSKSDSEMKDKIVQFVTHPIFISLTIILVAICVVLFFLREGPQEPAREKVKGQLENPKVVFEVYEDLQCPACRAFNPVFKQLVTAYADKSVKFVIHDFPLTTLHAYAQQSAEASEYANDHGKFWEFKDLIYDTMDSVNPSTATTQDNTPLTLDNLVKSGESLGLNGDEMRSKVSNRAYKTRINNEESAGVARGVNATPTIYINGVKFAGNNQLLEEFTKIIDPILAQ